MSTRPRGGTLTISLGRNVTGPTMRVPKVHSVAELSALAILLEQRAAQRFRLMAEAMAARGRDDLKDLFDRLAREEDRHEEAIRGAAPGLDDRLIKAHWPAELGEPPRPPDPRQLASASVYQCLAEAVRNEDKAFRFFSYLAANAEDPALAARAEALAKEELAHAALLRRARRAAYHRETPPVHGWPKARDVVSLEDLRRAALPRELALSKCLERAGLDPAVSRTCARIQALLAAQGGAALEALSSTTGTLEEESSAAFAFYDQVASNARDEALLLDAQALSALALERLKQLTPQDTEASGT